MSWMEYLCELTAAGLAGFDCFGFEWNLGWEAVKSVAGEESRNLEQSRKITLHVLGNSQLQIWIEFEKFSSSNTILHKSSNWFWVR